MKKTYRYFFRLIKDNFISLAAFEFIFKASVFILFVPLIAKLMNVATNNAGIMFITTKNVARLMKNPLMIVMTAAVILILICISYYEVCCIWMCYRKYTRGIKVSVSDMFVDGMIHLRKTSRRYGVKIYLPLLVLLILMIVFKVLKLGEDIGMPLMFLLSAFSGFFTGRKINILETIPAAIRTAAPVMGILMGVGMFIEVMTATGVRGFIVTSCLRLPPSFWLLACAISIPLFGAVSSYGACSVLGVPFAYIYISLLGGNSTFVLAAISLIASVGDMMPPTALAGLFAAQVVGVKDYTKILRKCIVPIVILLVWACFFLAKSKMIAGLF